MKGMLIGGVLLIIAVQAWGYSGIGAGTEENPYLVTSAAELDSVRYDLTAYYRLTADIPLDFGYSTVGWLPIGDSAASFTGVFDGNGHKISGLWINRPESDNIGLFGCIGGGIYELRVRDLTLELSDRGVTGKYDVGGLVGENYGGMIAGCTVRGNVFGYASVGMLAGYSMYSIVNRCSASGSVTGEQNVGGLLGWNNGYVDEGSNANVTVRGLIWVGGLVGFNYGNISRSYSTGAVTCEKRDEYGSGRYVGGLVGSSSGTIRNCHSSVAVKGEIHVGGLVGYNFATSDPYEVVGKIENCYSVGSVSGSSTWADSVGSLVGSNSGGEVKLSFYNSEISSAGVLGMLGRRHRCIMNHSMWNGISPVYGVSVMVAVTHT
jgi:hypothetical protein